MMRYKPFYPGDKVMTILDYEDIPSGTVGTVSTKWSGTAYVVKVADGTFQWLISSEFGSEDPSKASSLEEGDVGVVTSDEHHHEYAKIGDRFTVYKVVYDVDYYGIMFNNELRWYGGFQIVKYL